MEGKGTCMLGNTNPCPVCMGTGKLSVSGEVFRSAREVLNLSRQELADACGLSHVTIRNVENGLTNPNRETLQLILEELNSRGVQLELQHL